MSKEATEKNLLRQIALGDEASFERLFATYHKRLLYYITLFIKSPEIAEEVVMDVFMKIWLGRDIINEVDNFDSFLFRVAHNKAIDFLRSVSKDPDFKELMWGTMQLSTSEAADHLLLKNEFDKKVREAMSLLSKQRREIFTLSREQDLTHEQIAYRLGLSKNTVNNHIVEAKRFIRDYLAKSLNMPYILVLFFLSR